MKCVVLRIQRYKDHLKNSLRNWSSFNKKENQLLEYLKSARSLAICTLDHSWKILEAENPPILHVSNPHTLEISSNLNGADE